jgi:hypothetical protein
VREWRGEGDASAPLAAAADAVAAAGSARDVLELGLLRLFHDYWAELVPADGSPPRFGPDGHDASVLDELRDRAGQLLAAARDPRHQARAAFYAGLIADNLRDESGRAEELFTVALHTCRPGADDDYAAEALRHLGGCAEAAGDVPLARQRWERSAELAERAGWLPLALAQQALLAKLAAREGDKAAASLLAREVDRWAGALGLGIIAAQAE